MRHSSISGMAYSLGTTRLRVEESAEAGRLRSPAADLVSAGFGSHYICRPEETAYELAAAAVRELPLSGGVDAIVYNTCLPGNGNTGDPALWERTRDVKHLMDFPASRLQADFALSSAVVFGLGQQGCTGMLGALRLANALLAAEPDWGTVLCVTSDRFPDGALYEQSYNVISDGAAACLVSRDQGEPGNPGGSGSSGASGDPGVSGKSLGYRIVASHQITNGGLHSASDDETVGLFFSYVPRLVRQTVEKAGLTTADIDWVIPQNTNGNAWKIAARLLGFPEERICQSTLSDIGHAISADNVINLSALADSGAIEPGQRLLLVMAGHGLNWQATILEATETAP
ncbi:3-oxoacyl-[acyl-carrier-protein] synthase III C-terminal domain-containing protein [Streptomyces paludis]|nr:3-oxoacyl-[acyl-carrier-protein] synthase III C-terminal domain-containing protein [Streptomyces paludis]